MTTLLVEPSCQSIEISEIKSMVGFKDSGDTSVAYQSVDGVVVTFVVCSLRFVSGRELLLSYQKKSTLQLLLRAMSFSLSLEIRE